MHGNRFVICYRYLSLSFSLSISLPLSLSLSLSLSLHPPLPLSIYLSMYLSLSPFRSLPLSFSNPHYNLRLNCPYLPKTILLYHINTRCSIHFNIIILPCSKELNNCVRICPLLVLNVHCKCSLLTDRLPWRT